MDTNPGIDKRPEITVRSLQRPRHLSLSQQAELASHALTISLLLELINQFIYSTDSIKEIDIALVDRGIQYIEDLKRGEEYLSHPQAYIIQRRPDSIDTVSFIKDRADIRIEESGEQAIITLRGIKLWPTLQESLPLENLDSTRQFLRVVHSGIMTQLEFSDDADT